MVLERLCPHIWWPRTRRPDPVLEVLVLDPFDRLVRTHTSFRRVEVQLLVAVRRAEWHGPLTGDRPVQLRAAAARQMRQRSLPGQIPMTDDSSTLSRCEP